MNARYETGGPSNPPGVASALSGSRDGLENPSEHNLIAGSPRKGNGPQSAGDTGQAASDLGAEADQYLGVMVCPLTLPDGSSIPNGDYTPSYTQINLGVSHEFRLVRTGPLTVRFDVINITDTVCQIRSGSGVGVLAPQYGAPRGFFGGVAWQF
jgi:TonB dependent receptor